MNFDEHLLTSIEGKQNHTVKLIIDKFELHHRIDYQHHRTLLHYCARYGNETITKYLLDGGSLVDAQDSLGYTPLMEALRKRHDRVVEILLEAGTDVLVKNTMNRSALRMFFEEYSPASSTFDHLRRQFRKRYSSCEDAAKKLIEAGYRLDAALILKDAEIVEYMLQHGCKNDLSKKCSREIVFGGQTPLHLAVLTCDVESVKVLLKYGADVDAENNYPGAPVLDCLYRVREERDNPDQVEILKILLDAGASTVTSKRSPLSSVLKYGTRGAIKVLLNFGIDFSTKDSDERSALHYLAMNRNPGIAEELDAHADEFDYDALDKRGLSPLDVTMDHRNVSMLFELCSYKARARAPSRGGAGDEMWSVGREDGTSC